MLKIGQFAALAQISIRMLRHYDELGLLKPEMVDRESGYRYYTLEQLPRLNRILALKDLGLSLGEIRELLNGALSAEEIRGMLKLKQAQLHQHIIEEQARLRRVENRLAYIEHEGRLPDAEVIIKPQPALRVISRYGSAWPGHLFNETWPILRAHDLTQHIQGMMTLYHTSLEFQATGKRTMSEHAVEIAYIVDETVQALPVLPVQWRMRVYDLPAYPQVASLVSNKPDRERGLDAQALWQWMRLHHFRLIAPTRESYLKRPSEAAEYLTEMIFPIEPVFQEV